MSNKNQNLKKKSRKSKFGQTSRKMTFRDTTDPRYPGFNKIIRALVHLEMTIIKKINETEEDKIWSLCKKFIKLVVVEEKNEINLPCDDFKFLELCEK